MKTISVCIISREFLPNYLFLVEKAEETDEILLIVSKAFEVVGKYGLRQLETLGKKIDFFVLSTEDVEEDWDQIVKEVTEKLERNNKYLVNLTGGTKYLSMAVQSAFEDFNTEFFYIPFPKNYLIKAMHEDDNYKEIIKHRVNVKECLQTFGVKIESSTEPIGDFAMTKRCLSITNNRSLPRKLRRLQARLKAKVSGSFSQGVYISSKAIPENIKNFINNMDNMKYGEALNRGDINYINHGWFTEYIYYLIKNHVRPDDMMMNLHVRNPLVNRKEEESNRLDICFVKNNKLIVIGCRVFNSRKTVHENDLIYKSKAIKEALLGLSAKFIICAIGTEVGNRGDSMGIECYDTDYFINSQKTQEFISKIIGYSS